MTQGPHTGDLLWLIMLDFCISIISKVIIILILQLQLDLKFHSFCVMPCTGLIL